MSEKTYHGSCHCGAATFTATLDLARENSRCNCSICAKSRFWKAVIPAARFTLDQGEDVLVDYQFGERVIHHLFCGTCGIKVMGRAHFDAEFGGEPLKGDFVAVNLALLDDATPEELAAATVRYENGRDDDYEHPPAVTSHL